MSRRPGSGGGDRDRRLPPQHARRPALRLPARKLGGDYLGVDVDVAARVGDAASPGHVLVSDARVARIDVTGMRTGRAKRLRADGTPRDLHVVRVSRG